MAPWFSSLATRQQHSNNIEFLGHKEIFAAEYLATRLAQRQTPEDQKREIVVVLAMGRLLSLISILLMRLLSCYLW
jgi:hypothetical protein